MTGSWSPPSGPDAGRRHRPARPSSAPDDDYGPGRRGYPSRWERENLPPHAEDPWEQQDGDDDYAASSGGRNRGGHDYDDGYRQPSRESREPRSRDRADHGYPDADFAADDYPDADYPDRDYPDRGRADHGRGPRAYPERGRPDHGRPDHGHTDHGHTEHGHTPRPYQERGHPDHGYGDRGYPPQDVQAQAYEQARRREAARRRMLAEAQAMARAEAEALTSTAAVYQPRPIVNKTARRRQIAVVAVLGSAVAILGQRVASAFGKGGTAQAATTGTATTATGDGMAGAAPAAGGQVVLANTTDIPVGSAKIFPAHKLVVTQPAAGSFKAYSTVCTHAGCLLDQVKADKILCPCHPGVFNLDGSVASGPPPGALAAKQITVSGNQILL